MKKNWIAGAVAAIMLVTSIGTVPVLANEGSETNEVSLQAEQDEAEEVSEIAEQPETIVGSEEFEEASGGVEESESTEVFEDTREPLEAEAEEAEKSTPVIAIENADSVTGSFTVRIAGEVVPEGTAQLKIPVWGAVDGKNDLVWHTAKQDGTDYTVQVYAGEHAWETGLYNVHSYAVDAGGKYTWIAGTQTDVTFEKGVTAQLSEGEKTITVTARGVDPKASNVYFPIWSVANGQDDIVWAAAKKNASGEWTASISVKGHKNTGKYNIHCYALVNGVRKFFANTAVEVTAPTAEVSVENLDAEKGTFTVRISNLNVPSGVKSIQVPVWGENGGQNDIVWHTAAKSGEDYLVTVTAGQHKFETGKYIIHCYLTDGNDIFSFIGNTEATIDLKEGISATVSSDQMTASIDYIGQKAADSLYAAVWSVSGGQDDLRWYAMKQSGNGADVSVNISDHKTAGTYHVHIYSYKTGKPVFVTATTFTIDPLSVSSAEMTGENGSAGTFRVSVSGVTSASGVSKVRIPVWPTGDQSKIQWYTAKQSGDTWYVDVDVANHKYTFGDYTAHVYVYGNNGITSVCASAKTTIEAKNYLYAEKTGNTTRRVWLINPDTEYSAVLFPTWSVANGQDDIIWYNAAKSGNNWYADISSESHSGGGDFTTHCYGINVAGDKIGVGGITYRLSTPNSNQAMYDLAQGFSSDTQYLILVNRSLHRVVIYQGSKGSWKEIKYWKCVVGKPSTPTPAGTFKIKGRFDWFGSDHKCWWATQIEGYYYFHTVLYVWGDAPTTILDGTMDAAASAGCIRLDEPNARWIYTQIPRGTTVHIY